IEDRGGDDGPAARIDDFNANGFGIEGLELRIHGPDADGARLAELDLTAFQDDEGPLDAALGATFSHLAGPLGPQAFVVVFVDPPQPPELGTPQIQNGTLAVALSGEQGGRAVDPAPERVAELEVDGRPAFTGAGGEAAEDAGELGPGFGRGLGVFGDLQE